MVDEHATYTQPRQGVQVTNEELESLTFESIPEAFCRRLIVGVFQAYKTTYAHCLSNFATAEAENLWPYERRAKIEGYFRDAAALSPGLTASVVKAREGNWNHTEIRGGPLVLTESYVASPGAMVDRSDFRLSLATFNDLRLFEDEDAVTSDTLYVLLLHSRSKRLGAQDDLQTENLPGSIYFAFPTPGLRRYLHSINLFERFPETVRQETPQEWSDAIFMRFLDRSRKVA